MKTYQTFKEMEMAQLLTGKTLEVDIPLPKGCYIVQAKDSNIRVKIVKGGNSSKLVKLRVRDKVLKMDRTPDWFNKGFNHTEDDIYAYRDLLRHKYIRYIPDLEKFIKEQDCVIEIKSNATSDFIINFIKSNQDREDLYDNGY